VNRKQAWRTDGGTAAFGAAALTLAVVSTVLNFLYVRREEEYVWLPSLMWAVILWQSFLGWWWWVGAGSGSGLSGGDDIFEKMQREAKRESRRKEARERRRETKQRAKKVWMGVAGAFVTKASGNRERSPHLNHPMDSRDTSSPPTTPSDSPPGSPIAPGAPPSSVLSVSSAGTLSTLPRLLPAFVHRWYASLRHAHLVAARQQAVERVERIRELERNENTNARAVGWGLGSFGWRIGHEPVRGSGSRDFEMYNRSERSTRHEEHPDSRHDKEQDEQMVEDVEYPTHIAQQPLPLRPSTTARPRSMWWWGPLARWRLQDSTSY